jgi:transcriptional regulator with XRE-family HTH domain
MSIVLEKIGAKIRTIRQAKSLTQENVAEMLGMSHSGYAKIERGEVDLSVQRLEQIAKVFNVAAHEIMQLSESQNFVFSHSTNFAIGNNPIVYYQIPKEESEGIKADLAEVKRRLEGLEKIK